MASGNDICVCLFFSEHVIVKPYSTLHLQKNIQTFHNFK
jgi:hypothetical protein